MDFCICYDECSVPVEVVITQFGDRVRMRLTSQLLKSISRVLQKLLKYFDDTSISKCFVFKAAEFFPLILILDLNDSKFTIAASCSYIAIYYIAITFQKFLNTPRCLINGAGGRRSLLNLINRESQNKPGWGGQDFKIFVNIGNEWKKRHNCLILMLNLKVSKKKEKWS